MTNFESMPFAGDPLIGERIKFYRDALNIRTCIETGTQAGHTTRALSYIFEKVISLEISETAHLQAKANLEDRGNVTLLLAPSEVALSAWVYEGTRPVCFFLDAHGSGLPCPLLQELAGIATHRRDHDDLIVVHDFKVTDVKLGFDSYDGKDIEIEYVSEAMNNIWPKGWTMRCNDLALGARRGCAFFTSRR